MTERRKWTHDDTRALMECARVGMDTVSATRILGRGYELVRQKAKLFHIELRIRSTTPMAQDYAVKYGSVKMIHTDGRSVNYG